MPRHLKKTAVKPTSGMPQTRQFAASSGVLVSKGALIATHPISFCCRVTLSIVGFRVGPGQRLDLAI